MAHRSRNRSRDFPGLNPQRPRTQNIRNRRRRMFGWIPQPPRLSSSFASLPVVISMCPVLNFHSTHVKKGFLISYELRVHNVLINFTWHHYINVNYIFTWISRSMIEKGYEKAMFPRAWNANHTFAPLFSAGLPLTLPSIFPFSSFQNKNIHWSLISKTIDNKWTWPNIKSNKEYNSNYVRWFIYIYTYDFVKGEAHANEWVSKGHNRCNKREP